MTGGRGGPWHDLLARWDVQQAVYIEQRERVYDVMFEVLGRLRPVEDPVVLDLACGPGSLSRRLLARVPGACCVAVDIDPVMLAIGEGALGDLGGRLRWVHADLRDPGWATALDADGAPGRFDAVLSSTATHWLDPASLAATYRRAWTLLRPDGVLLNADWIDHPAGSRLRAACDALALERERRAVAAGAEDADAWWAAAAAEPLLADALARRARLWGPDAREWQHASHAFHHAALRDAGFAEVGDVWQGLQVRILAALR
jgi:SAM-dependent methyltransferase